MRIFRGSRAVATGIAEIPELLYHHRFQAYQEETDIRYNAQGVVVFDTDRHNHLDLRTVGPCSIRLDGTPRTATATNPLIVSLQRNTRAIYAHAFETPVQWVTGYAPRWASGYGEVDKLLLWWEPGPARWFGATFYPGPVAYYPLLTKFPSNAAAIFIMTNLSGSSQTRIYDALGSGAYLELFGNYSFVPQGLALRGGYALSTPFALNMSLNPALHGVFYYPGDIPTGDTLMSLGHPFGRGYALGKSGASSVKGTWQPQGVPSASTPPMTFSATPPFNGLEVSKFTDSLYARTYTPGPQADPVTGHTGAAGDGAKFAASGNRLAIGASASDDGARGATLTCSMICVMPESGNKVQRTPIYTAFAEQLAGATGAGGKL